MRTMSKNKYRLFRRSTGIYFIQDNSTGRQESLKTRNKQEAVTLLNASNEANRQPFLNLQIARTYLMGTDPKMVTRTWQEVMEKVVSLKHGPTKHRWSIAIRDRAYDGIRRLPLLETRAEHFLKAMENDKPGTNVYLRRVHNFALGMDWLLKAIMVVHVCAACVERTVLRTRLPQAFGECRRSQPGGM